MTLIAAEPAAAQAAKPSFAVTRPIHIHSVALKVRDLPAMTAFYSRIMGMDVISQNEAESVLGKDGQALFILKARPSDEPDDGRSAGLFHTAFLMPDRASLGKWLIFAVKNGVPFTGFSDHLVSEALYLDDPEGNGIEVYADRAPDTWKWDGGSVAMATDQLDIDGLLALTDTHTTNYAKAPDDLRIGHMHLRVGDLEQADRFYGGAVGFDPTRKRSGAAFLSSGRYHHHLGINVWQSAGAGPRDDTATGLAWFSLEVATQQILEAQTLRLRQAGAPAAAIADGIETSDPWGTKLRLIKV